MSICEISKYRYFIKNKTIYLAKEILYRIKEILRFNPRWPNIKILSYN